VEKLQVNEPQIAHLWQLFGQTRDGVVRERLIDHYLPLAKMIAAKLFGLRADNSIGFSDYLQYARIGLIESVDRFDLTRNVPFEAYASHRIRGAVLNGLHNESEAAAQRGFWRTHAQDRVGSLVEGRSMAPASLGDLIEITVGLALGALLDLEPRDIVDEGTCANPYAATELDQMASAVRALLPQLPEREREVIEGHYFGRQEFQAIAARFGVSKGRVSQLHARALQRLREALNEQPRINRKL
jgi:RNA polymerase sigma factor for flagellar operon FliA